MIAIQIECSAETMLLQAYRPFSWICLVFAREARSLHNYSVHALERYFWSFTTDMCMTNRTMGIPALEDRLLLKIMIFLFLCLALGNAAYRSVYSEG